MRRTEAREHFMQLLFQMETQGDFSSEAKDRFVTLQMEGSGQLEYFNDMYALIREHKEEIDGLIQANSHNWKLSRLAKVDLAVLRLAIAELMYRTDIPDGAVINEAVELAKRFGGEESGKYVNGILGKLARGKEA